MPRFLTQRRAIVLLAVLAFFSSLLRADWAGRVSKPPKAVVQALLMPVTHLLNNNAAAVRGDEAQPTGLGTPEQIEKNYMAALAYNRRLEAQNLDLIAQIRRLTQTSQIGIAKTIIEANVIGWSSDLSTITINRGSRYDLRPGLAVMDGANLVGRITDQNLNPMAATVRLINSPGTLLDVRLVAPTPTAAKLEVRCQLQVSKDRRSFFAVIDSNSPLKEGDLAHLDDNYWPAEARGSIVGQVKRIGQDPDDPTLRRRVIVEPLPNLAALSRVTVIMPKERDAGASRP